MREWNPSSKATARLRWQLVTLVSVALLAWAGAGITASVASPVITTVAGGGTPTGGNGDSGPATSAHLTKPVDVAFDVSGNLYIADVAIYVGDDGFKVRRVATSGIITTVAGNGSTTFNGDGIPATSAGISVNGIAVDRAGNLFIADRQNERVRKVAPGGIVTTVAGTGTMGYSGDGGLAKSAQLNLPNDVATDAAGNVFVVDTGNQRIRRVGVDGVIRTIAGNGQYGFSGDGGPATAASLNNPEGVAVDGAGNVYIADFGNDRIRKVTPAGIISTIAGGGPFRSDPVAANVKLLHPHGVAVDGRGNVYVAEMNNLVRVVSPDGIIQVVAGPFNDSTFGNEGAPAGFSGDGGPAAQALINEPRNLALDAKENLFIADSGNGRVRRVTAVPTSATPEGLGAFLPYKPYSVGSFTQHVAIADVTGDRRDDAILTTTTWGGPAAEPANDFKVLVFVQKTDGTLAPPLKYAYPGDAVGGRSGMGLATGDLNRDGFADVVVGTLNGVEIFRGTPTGLSAGVLSAGVDNAQAVTSVALLDVDRDGKLDIVTLGCCSAAGGTSPTDKYGMTIHYGNGLGGVDHKTLFPVATGEETGGNLHVADINRDGMPDLVKTWSGYQIGGVAVLLHNATTGFNAPLQLRPQAPGWVGAAYAIGDFNQDDLPDFMLTRDGNAPDAAYIHLAQDAQHGFVQQREWAAYDAPEDLISADMNGDGRDDLLVVHGGWHSIGYQQQTWKGLDTEVKYYTVQSGNPSPPSIAVGDLNHDGCKDVAMADYNGGLIVMQGANCWIARHDSAPLPLPGTAPPAAPATTDQQVPQQQSDPTPAAAVAHIYVRIVRAIAVAWPGAGSLRGRIVLLAGIGFGLFAVLWWLLRVGPWRPRYTR